MKTIRFRIPSAVWFLPVLAALTQAPLIANAGAAPLSYTWTGTLAPGAGPLDGLDFAIAFTVPVPAQPDDASGSSARYFVSASLSLQGIGDFVRDVVWELNAFTDTTAGLGAFSDILIPGDSLFFGICTGGACDDPVLWNSEPFAPVLFTGVFPLGLESSCSFPGPCSNALANYFDGQGGGSSTGYLGTLTASAVPLPAALWLLGAALGMLGFTRRARGWDGRLV